MAVKLEILSQQQDNLIILVSIKLLGGRGSATPNDQNIFFLFDVVHRVLTGHVLHIS